MRRRRLLLPALVVLAPIVVLGVEVRMAVTAPRLDDEIGQRPTDLVVRPGADPLHVVWLGDSTTTGVGADPFETSMAHRVASGVTDGAVTLTVLGVSGDQVHEVNDAQVPVLAATDPDVVFVSIGANDVTALTRRPTFRSRYGAMLDGIVAAAPDAALFLVGIPDMGTAPRLPVPLRQIAGARAAMLDDDIEDLVAERGLDYIDLAGPTSGTFSSDPDRYFSGDDFHPSTDGHAVWADAVLAGVDALGGVGG